MKRTLIYVVVCVLSAVAGFAHGITAQSKEPVRRVVLHKIKPNIRIRVIKLMGYDPIKQEAWTGTGWLLESPIQHLVISNSHVCGDAKEMATPGNQPNTYFHLLVIAHARMSDLCILLAEDIMPLPAEGLKLAPNKPQLKDKLVTYGFPGDSPLTRSELTYTGEDTGRIEGSTQLGKVTDIASGYVYPGDSGSPVLNAKGEVVGVIVATNIKNKKALFVTLGELKAFLSGNEGPIK